MAKPQFKAFNFGFLMTDSVWLNIRLFGENMISLLNQRTF